MTVFEMLKVKKKACRRAWKEKVDLCYLWRVIVTTVCSTCKATIHKCNPLQKKFAFTFSDFFNRLLSASIIENGFIICGCVSKCLRTYSSEWFEMDCTSVLVWVLWLNLLKKNNVDFLGTCEDTSRTCAQNDPHFAHIGLTRRYMPYF